MLTTPTVQNRKEQHYVAISTKASMKDIPAVLPPLVDEVLAWLKKITTRRTVLRSSTTYLSITIMNWWQKLG